MRALAKKLLAVAEPSSPFWIYTCRYKRAISISLGVILEKRARALNEKLRRMFELIMRVRVTVDDGDVKQRYSSGMIVGDDRAALHARRVVYVLSEKEGD